MSTRKAMVLGVTGMDGATITPFLLKKGYQVIGIKRRTSTDTTERIKQYLDNPKFILDEGDLTDSSSMGALVEKYKPDELYLLAAMSQVAVSFKQPAYTFMCNAVGPLNVFEAVRIFSPKTKVYFAGTSEEFGNNYSIDCTFSPVKKVQSLDTPLGPASPYAAAKCAAHYLAKVYRESYGLFISVGILFNHESVPKNTPVIIKKNNLIDVLPIEDLFRTDSHKYEGILDNYYDSEIWDGENWTKIIAGTCYQDKNKKINCIQSVSQVVESTKEHTIFMENGQDIESQLIKEKDKLYNTQYPEFFDGLTFCDLDLAKFIGFVVGDGYINKNKIRLTGCDKSLLINIAELITKKFGWVYTLRTDGPGKYEGCVKDIWQLDISADFNFATWISKNIYTNRSEEKRVPYFILNSNLDIKKAFFDGYYLADGRKAGWEKYKYKGFTTSSSTLCLGLILLMKQISPNQLPKVKIEHKNNKRYYRTCFRSPNSNGKHHRCKDLNEVIKIFETESSDGWFYDLQTESKTFAIGPNLVKIHNSPIRGEEFVTRKITKWIAKFNQYRENKILKDNCIENDKITRCGFPKLRLGNIDSFRDWSHAVDMVRGMWMILQHDKPDDFLLASGETHTVREFLEIAFSHIGIKNWQDYIYIDPEFLRPNDVQYLCGKADKAKEILGWEPTITFEELVKEMVEADIAREKEKIH